MLHPRAPREAFHALRGRRKVIHALQGGSSMRSKGGDPHAVKGGDPHGVPHASMGRHPRALRATIHDTFRFLIRINPDSDSTLQPSVC